MFKRVALFLSVLLVAGAARGDISSKKFDWTPAKVTRL